MQRTFHILLALFIGAALFGQTPGSSDATFNVNDLGNGIGDGGYLQSNSLVVQIDGKILITGASSGAELTGPPVPKGISRFNADGSRDLTWVPAEYGTVDVAVQQPDGKVLIGGSFGVRRLTTSGTLDGSFSPASFGGGTSIKGIALLSSGKIIVGGWYTLVNGVPGRQHLVRLNANGTLDTSFNPVVDGPVYHVSVASTGSILIAGSFMNVNSVARSRVARLTSTGALDTTFDPGTNVPGTYQLLLKPDGGCLISDGPSSAPHLIALTSTGALDPAFSVTLQPGQGVQDMGLLSDGRIVITGSFSSMNGVPCNRIALMDASGTLDPSFDSGSGLNGYGYALAVQGDNKTVLAGSFTFYRGVQSSYLVRVNPDGTDDAAFDPPMGLKSITGPLTTVLQQADERILVGGSSMAFWSDQRVGVLRLLPDGSFDGSFNAQVSGFPYTDFILGYITVNDIVEQPDGKILLAGAFGNCGGQVRKSIARVNSDGTLDASFDPGGAFDSPVDDIELLPDGDIVATTRVAGSPTRKLVRLNADGSADPEFIFAAIQITSSFGLKTHTLPGGRLLLSGSMTTYGGQSCGPIVRLLADGTMDAGFSTAGAFATGSGPITVRQAVVQGDGRIVVCGNFTSVQGIARAGLARLMPDGALDPTFVPAVAISGYAYQLVARPDGKFIVDGRYLLNNDGSLDASWNSGSGFTANTSIVSSRLQSDGKLLVLGYFTSYNGIGRNRVARITGHPQVQMPLQVRALLEGPYNAGLNLMHDSLRTQDLIPLVEPFSGLGFAHMSESLHPPLDPGALGLGAPFFNSVVDWALVELRSSTQPGLILQTRSGLLQRDGDIVDLDGSSPLLFNNVAGSYHVAVRHRNHHGVMTASPVALSSSNTVVNFSLPTTATYGTEGQKPSGTRMVLWAGDATHNGAIKYTGAANDRDPILVRVGSTTPNASAPGYFTEDVNMDGTVKYTGSANDRDPILVNVGSTAPNNVRVAQLP